MSVGKLASIDAALVRPICSIEDGKSFIDALMANGLDFHLEDDPDQFIDLETEEPVFHVDDLPILREQVSSLYDLDWAELECPIGYMLERMGVS